MEIVRTFANPSADTFSVPPIGEFVKNYLRKSKVSVDPFARNKQWATHTNDLNPETSAEFHLDAFDFLEMLLSRGVQADLVLFDPPYTRQQVKEVYSGIGRHYGIKDTQYHSLNWKREREIIDKLLSVGGYVLSFGYHSNGMQWSGPYEIEKILLVNHGSNHYDTICMAEKKIASQQQLFDLPVVPPPNKAFHANC